MKEFLKEREKGITLIALVITIVILLILAGVTIATLTGENGILTKASDAKTETEEGKEDELRRLTALEAAINIEGTMHIEKDTETGEVKEEVKIPAGFAVSQVEGENSVENGLVIIDKNGNEFVWVQVDGILEEDGTIDDVVNNEKILLGRYDFDSSGTPSEYSGIYIEENSRNTDDLLNYGNTIANDIEGFIDSVRENGGYYIARFEASQGTNGKAESKYDKAVWNNITQPNASKACQNLYETIDSDLVNSYAWDTTLLFIQKYSGDIDYSRQKPLQDTLANTGKATDGTIYDVRCNIYDMSGNCYEHSTETRNQSGTCISPRGGSYWRTNDYTSFRGWGSSKSEVEHWTFRTILYF